MAKLYAFLSPVYQDVVFKIAPENKNIPFVFSELDKMLIGKDVMLALSVILRAKGDEQIDYMKFSFLKSEVIKIYTQDKAWKMLSSQRGDTGGSLDKALYGYENKPPHRPAHPQNNREGKGKIREKRRKGE